MVDLAKGISDALPYVGAALKISKTIFGRLKNYKKNMLVVVDDVADLLRNWETLSFINEYDFRYLLVIRVNQMITFQC